MNTWEAGEDKMGSSLLGVFGAGKGYSECMGVTFL